MTFYLCITKQQYNYHNIIKDFNVQSPTVIALNNRHQWEAPTANSQIVAQNAQLSTLLLRQGKQLIPLKLKKTTKWRGDAKFGKNDKEWAWKDKAPKKGDPKTNGKMYHSCFKHEAWT